MTQVCPVCRRELAETRLGVPLGAIKTQLFDLVKISGTTGIGSDELQRRVLPGRARNTVKAHIWQINELIEDQGYRIVSDKTWRRRSNTRASHASEKDPYVYVLTRIR
jgi:hypothetical protein